MAEKKYIDTYIVGEVGEFDNNFSTKLTELQQQVEAHFGSENVTFISDVKRKDQIYTYIDLEYKVEE